jgi:hypothetical protein
VIAHLNLSATSVVAGVVRLIHLPAHYAEFPSPSCRTTRRDVQRVPARLDGRRHGRRRLLRGSLFAWGFGAFGPVIYLAELQHHYG